MTKATDLIDFNCSQLREQAYGVAKTPVRFKAAQEGLAMFSLTITLNYEHPAVPYNQNFREDTEAKLRAAGFEPFYDYGVSVSYQFDERIKEPQFIPAKVRQVLAIAELPTEAIYRIMIKARGNIDLEVYQSAGGCNFYIQSIGPKSSRATLLYIIPRTFSRFDDVLVAFQIAAQLFTLQMTIAHKIEEAMKLTEQYHNYPASIAKLRDALRLSEGLARIAGLQWGIALVEGPN